MKFFALLVLCTFFSLTSLDAMNSSVTPTNLDAPMWTIIIEADGTRTTIRDSKDGCLHFVIENPEGGWDDEYEGDC